MYGDPFYAPYSDAGDFYWLRPFIWPLLMSAKKGLFIWHPGFLFAIIGLPFTVRQNKRAAMIAILGLLIQLYIIASWSWWHQGAGFGIRMLISCTPFFVLGLASLIDQLSSRNAWLAAYATAAFLLVWNFLFYVEFRFYLTLKELTQSATWQDVTTERVMFFVRLLGLQR